MSFLEGFELADGTGWKAAAQAAPAALAGFQAIKAKREYGIKAKEIETLMENRQQLNNPYANISNPFANLQVATKAAEMQAEQSDIALANTLDSLRQTGAGGATALAQAALKSKQGVTANIQQQEAQNQRLQAQGQQRVDLAKAQGQMQTMMLQERRTEADLTRLQDQADLLKAQQIYSTQSAMSSLGTSLETLAGGIVPAKLPETEQGNEAFDLQNGGFTEGQKLSMQGRLLDKELESYDPTSGMDIFNENIYDPTSYSMTQEFFANPQSNKGKWETSGLNNMVKERERLKQAGQSTDAIQALIDSTRLEFGI
jgi:hypothetical protein